MKRGTYLEVDLNNFEYNLNNIKKYVEPKQLLPIIKANAYGMGAKAVIDILNKNNIQTVCVAIVPEAIELKDNGYKGDVLVLDTCTSEELDDAVKYNLILGSCSEKEITKLNQKAQQNNTTARIHLEIEAGSYRAGIEINKLQEYIDLCKTLKNINIEGVYTYFAGSEKDKQYVQYQFDTIKNAVDLLNKNNIFPKCVHMANIGLIHELQEDKYVTAVRSGLVLYGHNENDNLASNVDIKPVSKLVSSISFLKDVQKDESISYGRNYIAKQKEKIATIPIGYADGFPRSLSNKGRVVINDKICNIVGNICMDSILVDVSGIDNVKTGDKVYLWDNNNITVEDLAKDSNTINYEIISRIAPRVERKYI